MPREPQDPAQSSKANLIGWYVDNLREELRTADPYWLELQKESFVSLASHRVGVVLEQARITGVMADRIGNAGSGSWIDQAKGLLGPVNANVALYEQMLGRVLRPVLGSTGFDDILRALRNPSHELKKEVEETGKKLAREAFAESTPEGAFQKFLDSLRGLDPLKQFFLVIIFGPLFVGVVLSVVNPVTDHYVKQWLNDSPQGAQKQAETRVLTEAGGRTVLAGYRLVIAKPSLLVRQSPAAQGKRMGSVEFGTVVRAVREEGAFTLVEWRGEGDVVLVGWVFTRYLKRF